ncbi:hypothetical protein [Kushneria phosphatilytica]|uniref:Pectate lyase superfamily protein domain-containing protein n=1 Tax=Kushneria phosphatilytica TaxID=657387 RepID=A0A5C0ZYY8_9GAMM|nr:hypothetical protein [Kushneria phosphatilytica]QEL09969.1 hypothetical protein FY550_01685 [Kushneria phosphatilytica]
MSDSIYAAMPTLLVNVDDLRDYTPSENGERVKTNYHTYQGFGGGIYYYDASDTESEDNGGSILVTSNGARFKREWGDSDGTNVLDWGADPFGQTDTGPICRTMLASGLRTLYFPNHRFMIDTMVKHTEVDENGNENPVQIILKGSAFDWFAVNEDNVGIFAGPNLKHDPSHDDPDSDVSVDPPNADGQTIGFSEAGWMFFHVMEATDLSFFGDSRESTGSTCLRTNGYVHRIQRCSFHNFYAALGQLTAASRVSECTFTYCNFVAYSVASLATTVSFQKNSMQFCDTCLHYTGELVGATIADNIWEHCGPGPLVSSATMYSIAFYGNWFEDCGGYDADGNPTRLLVVRDSQQTKSNWAGSNSFHAGNIYTNPFEPPLTEEGYSQTSGLFGGVSFDYGGIQINSGTGNSTLLDNNGITQRLDAWSGYEPLRLESGHNEHGAPALQLRGAGAIELTGRSDVETGDATVFNHPFRFLKDAQVTTDDQGTKSYGEGLYEELRLHWDESSQMAPGLVGMSPLPNGRQAITSIPMDVCCRDDGLQRGQEAFNSIDRSTEGQVIFEAPFDIQNPIITITVEDRGIICDGWLLSSESGDTGNNGESRWRNYLTVYFVNRATGEAQTPISFCMRLSTHE